MLLARLVQAHGVKQWAVISSALPGRTGKQVRPFTILASYHNRFVLARIPNIDLPSGGVGV